MHAWPRLRRMGSFRFARNSGSREVPLSDHTGRCVGCSLFTCPVRSCRGTGSFPCGDGPEGFVWLAFYLNDCDYGGDTARDPGFAYRVSGWGSCSRQSSFLEACCGGCVGRADSSFGVAFGRGRVSTATPIGWSPANDLCGCGRRCWPYGACFVLLP